MAREEPLGSKTDESIEAAGADKAPWGWGTLLIAAFLGGFGAVGIIAGLNWRRMGFDKFMWPTIIGAMIAFVLQLVVIASAGFDPLVNILGLFAVWWGLVLWQRPYYQTWKEINREAQRAGWQIPVVAVVVSFALGLVGGFLT